MEKVTQAVWSPKNGYVQFAVWKGRQALNRWGHEKKLEGTTKGVPC